MIRIHRTPLPPNINEHLQSLTDELLKDGLDGKKARAKWGNAKAARKQVRSCLDAMAMGIKACMYCGDHLSADVDHFEPVAQAPHRVFDWLNHLLACAHCNSHQKRDQFPRDENGMPLLVDPSAEDPHDHLMLTLATGQYECLTRRGEVTISVFGLNRDDLIDARASAFEVMRSVLLERVRHFHAGNITRANRLTKALFDQPFIDVLYTMLRHRDHPRAALLLGGHDVVDALADPVLDLWT